MTTATKPPPALCAYCPACGLPAVPLSAKGTYRVHRRCANGRGSTVATDANIARWVMWETNTAGAGANTCADRVSRLRDELSRLRDELARAEVDHAAYRARLAAITAIAAARGIAPKDPAR